MDNAQADGLLLLMLGTFSLVYSTFAFIAGAKGATGFRVPPPTWMLVVLGILNLVVVGLALSGVSELGQMLKKRRSQVPEASTRELDFVFPKWGLAILGALMLKSTFECGLDLISPATVGTRNEVHIYLLLLLSLALVGGAVHLRRSLRRAANTARQESG